MSTNTARAATRQQLVGVPSVDDNVLLIDDDPGTIQLMGRILADVGTLRFATNGQDALRLARECIPDLILLDAQMPGISGFQLFDKLQAESQLADVPVIFVTSHCESGFEASAFDMGAADFIPKPLKSSVVLARVRTQLRLKHLADELRRNATTDALTRVASRRHFDESLQREWSRGQRAGDPISLLLIDLDHFRLYNERYGRPKGDSCLRHIAAALVASCRRPADLVARCGGEEFMVLLPQTARHGAEHMAQRMMQAVQDLALPHQDSVPSGHVTISVGIACYDENTACWVQRPEDHRLEDESHALSVASDLVLAADKALNAAKCAGRAQYSLLDIGELDCAEPELHIPLAPRRVA